MTPGTLCRLVQLTAARNNQAESLEAERETCEQHRAAIAELAEEALAAKVLLAPNLSDSCALLSRFSTASETRPNPALLL